MFLNYFVFDNRKILPYIIVITLFQLILLTLHEMDAVRNKEWRMIFLFKNMEDEKAYNLFLLLHIPFYLIILFCFALFAINMFFLLIFNFAFIVHLFLHIIFRKHKENTFSKISYFIISLLAAFGILNILLILLFNNK